MNDKEKLSIRINHPGGDQSCLVGWIYVDFEAADKKIRIHVSDVFSPSFELVFVFWDLMAWKLPQYIDIDEEGRIKTINILPCEDDGRVRFQIEDYDYGERYEEDPDYPRVYMDIELDLDELVEEFFVNLISFLENDFMPARWRKRNLKEFFLPKIKNEFFTYTKDKNAYRRLFRGRKKPRD